MLLSKMSQDKEVLRNQLAKRDNDMLLGENSV